MLKERPFARDLRVVSGILKLVEDLERLGDHAEDIKAFAKKLKDYEYVSIKKLDEAYKESTKMVLDSISSLVNKDEAQAYEVIKNDEKCYVSFAAIDPSLPGSKAERTAGSIADAGYKLARSFRCISLIELKAQFPKWISLGIRVKSTACETVNKSSKSMNAI